MWERRPMLGALIGLTLCISIWKISLQEPPVITEIPYVTSVITITNNNINNNQTTNLPISLIIEKQLDKNDYNNLIDLNDFIFNINHKSCNEMQIAPLVLILVHSAPNNINKRNLIRETWGRDDPHSLLLFLLGGVNTTNLQLNLLNENEKYQDIIQGNFYDAYKNMTYKHVMALKWFTYYCPDAKYILKTDDDVFVNTPNVYDYLNNNTTALTVTTAAHQQQHQQHQQQQQVEAKKRKLIFCWEVLGSRVKRTYRSKWRVSTKEYPYKFYPPYCPGFSIIYSSDTAIDLYKEAQKTPYFWIDDVHITGTLAQKINTNITPLGNLFLTEQQKNSIINDKMNASNFMFLFTTPNLRENEIRKLWKSVLSGYR